MAAASPRQLGPEYSSKHVSAPKNQLNVGNAKSVRYDGIDRQICCVWGEKMTKDELQFTFYMPGLSKEDVKILVLEKVVVSIDANREKDDYDGRYRRYGAWIDFPEGTYELTKIKARMQNGLLKVTIPKQLFLIEDSSPPVWYLRRKFE